MACVLNHADHRLKSTVVAEITVQIGKYYKQGMPNTIKDEHNLP